APLAGAECAVCHTDLTPGAKFCHRCGTPAAASADGRQAAGAERGLRAALPWAVAAITLVALIALLAGQHFNRPNESVGATSSDLPAAAQSGAAPVDISQMTPQERA